jgi:hypothetical protein
VTADDATSVAGDDILDEAAWERHRRNMEAFRGLVPHIHARFTNYKSGARLVRTEDGGYDVEFRGIGLYEKSAEVYAREQIEAFWEAPARVMVDPPDSDAFDPKAAAFIYRMLERASDEELVFSAQIASKKSYHLVVFGIGLAPHLETLIEQTECYSLVLVEPNLEFLYHSTFVHDWAGMLARLEERDVKLNIFISSNPVGLASDIKNFIRFVNAASIDGIVFFTHYQNHAFSQALQTIYNERALLAVGLGFFEDEIYMISHTYQNLVSGEARVFKYLDKRIPAPVFIIGGGPSKDLQYDFLRANMHRAVIVSCGSALESLLAEGIRPDFHFLLERNVEVYDIAKATSDERDLSGVCLVASSTVDPRIKALFDRTIFFFRMGLSPFPIFGEAIGAGIRDCDPEVVNAALAFSQIVGFRQFYFFGVDLGSRDPDVHHSKHSWNMRGELEAAEHHELSVPIPGNFGGTVYSHPTLTWVRDVLQRAIASWSRGRFYTNCSDGGLIRGAIPKQLAGVSLGDIPDGRVAVVEDIINAFPTFTTEQFNAGWAAYDIRNAIRTFHERMTTCLAENAELRDDAYLHKMMRVFHVSRPDLGMAMLYRGTMTQVLIAAEYFLNRLEEPDDLEVLERIISEEMVATMDNLRDEALEAVEKLEQGISPT